MGGLSAAAVAGKLEELAKIGETMPRYAAQRSAARESALAPRLFSFRRKQASDELIIAASLTFVGVMCHPPSL